MKVKTAKATGRILDWAASKAASIEGVELHFLPRSKLAAHYFGDWSPSTKYEQGGRLMELFGISSKCHFLQIPDKKLWVARIDDEFRQDGPTQLIASMRCLASVHFSEEIDVPDFLMNDKT